MTTARGGWIEVGDSSGANVPVLHFTDGSPPRTLALAGNLVSLNLRDYGAVGDGVTDDSSALFAALAAKEASTYGAVIDVPLGIYKVAGPFELGIKPLWLRGHGWNRPDSANFGSPALFTNINGTIFKTSSATQDLFVANTLFASNFANAYRGITLSDFAVLGPGSGNTFGVRFAMGADQDHAALVSHALVSNVLFCNFRVGFDPGGVEESTFEKLQFMGCPTGLRLGDVTSAISPTSLLIDKIIAEFSSTVGVDVRQVGTTKIYDLTTQSNAIGIQIDQWLHGKLTFNHTEGNSTAGLYININGALPTGLQHVEISGLRAGTATDGIVFSGTGGISWCNIHDCDFRAVPGDFVIPANTINTMVFVHAASGVVRCANGCGDMFVFNEGRMYFDNGQIFKDAGAGSPEGVVTGPPGCEWTNRTGGAGTTFYVKETGTGNVGWASK